MPRVFKPRAGFHAPSYHSHHNFQQDQFFLGVRIREVLWWQRLLPHHCERRTGVVLGYRNKQLVFPHIWWQRWDWIKRLTCLDKGQDQPIQSQEKITASNFELFCAVLIVLNIFRTFIVGCCVVCVSFLCRVFSFFKVLRITLREHGKQAKKATSYFRGRIRG